MQTIHVNSIIIEENRQRREVDEDAVIELANSILNLGLLHAPVFRNDGKTLVAGYRRYLAMLAIYNNKHVEHRSFTYQGEEVPYLHVPFTMLGDLSPDQIKEAELDENIKRVPLTWQEQARAITELHNLREEQAGRRGEKHQVRDTANELSRSGEATDAQIKMVRQSILLDAFADDPDVAAAKDKKEAIKLVTRKLEEKKHEALAQQFLKAKPDSKHELIKGDLLELLPRIADEQFDCTIADPPYGQGIEGVTAMRAGGASKHKYKDDEEYSDAIIETIARECFRTSKPKAHLFLFVSSQPQRQVRVMKILQDAGWYVWKTPLLWYRGNMGFCPRPEHGPRRSYESILYCIKGDKKFNPSFKSTSIGYLDVFMTKHETGIDYAAHKPSDLYAELIGYGCYPGDKVLDPCCGSGPIFPAATKTQTIAVGIEISEEACGIASKRMNSDADILD